MLMVDMMVDMTVEDIVLPPPQSTQSGDESYIRRNLQLDHLFRSHFRFS